MSKQVAAYHAREVLLQLEDFADRSLDFGGGDDKLSDLIVLPQTYKTLSVQKDIILHATGDAGMGESGAVTISFVDQTFKQIPEPSSLALIALGMMAFGFFRRRG